MANRGAVPVAPIPQQNIEPATDNTEPPTVPALTSPTSDIITGGMPQPSLPVESAAGASDKVGQLRGLKPVRVVDTDPKTAHPTLSLSGRIISATFVIPFNVGFMSGAEWVGVLYRNLLPLTFEQTLQPRRGNSALFDSFSHLAAPSSRWSHTLLGWTGEIRNDDTPSSPNASTPSAPIPVDGNIRAKRTNQVDGIRIHRDDRKRLERKLELNTGGKIVPVWLTDEGCEDEDVHVVKDQNRWRRYGEKEMYTVFHYKNSEPTEGSTGKKSWADYCRLNQLFADRILEIYNPGDLVIIHDCNLMLLPSLLRQRLPHAYIGFFLHIPFPSSEYFRCIGKRKEILEGVLGANMIGFQSLSYSRHFLSCCTRILGFDSSLDGVEAYESHVAVDAIPIGIDADSAEKAAFQNPAVAEKIAGIQALYAGKKIIIGRDRLDTVRGVPQKLQAFRIFLERYPEWHEKVVLIQITSPSEINTDGNDGESKSLNKISDLASEINGLYGSLGFTPVQHYPQYFSKEEYFALLRVADVALITSVRDGTNTTSLEYVICQKDKHSPLIISEFSGTSASLDGALHVNPWDLGGVADAINHALCMSDSDKWALNMKLYQHVVENNVQAWTENYINSLLTNLETFNQSSLTPVLDRSNLLQQYRQAKKRLFMFDYDGTLTPIVQDPAAAIPTDRLIRALKQLASDPNNTVWIISGRDQVFLNQYLGCVSELGLSAEHGCFMRRPKSEEWENVAAHTDMGWQPLVGQVFERYTEKTPGTLALFSYHSQNL